jgi:predicted MPP superfamily phosphohydrolase
MKIYYYSDLHVEFGDEPTVASTKPDDVVVLAGDIHVGWRGIEWARRKWPQTRIVYVLGNHEFYGAEYYTLRAEARACATKLGVDLLDPDSIVIGGIRFAGCTLWTDFKINGNSEVAQEEAIESLSDYARIALANRPSRIRRRLLPADTVQFHHSELEWLKNTLSQPFSGKTVVVTHHAPLSEASAQKYRGSLLQAAFCSDLRDMMTAPVSLWISGHTHFSGDCALPSGTRWVSNQAG